MKKLKFKFNQVDITRIDDRLLLTNLYFTQALTLLLACMIIWFQDRSILEIFVPFLDTKAILWGAVFGVIVVTGDLVISRFVPEEVTDDGGINEKLFKKRPLWHIVILCVIISICEELLFRGAIQHAWGAYWTSILFTAIHLRYLRHWLMTGLVFSISYGLGWIYDQTGSLWTPIVAHFLIDLIMGCIIRFGGTDSGNKKKNN